MPTNTESAESVEVANGGQHDLCRERPESVPGPLVPGPLFAGNAVLHHFGFVVSSIVSAAENFVVSLSARWDGKVIHDPIQGVRVAFFEPADPRNPVVELVEPASEGSPVSYFLKRKGGGLHHLCYEVDDLESGLPQAKSVVS